MKLKQTGELAPIDKPQQLIRDSVYDVSLQEKLKSIKINMGLWHLATGKECLQCLAGATISRRLGVDTNESYFPGYFIDKSIPKRLKALDFFRTGSIKNALNLLGLPPVMDDREITDYHKDSEQFKKDMLTLADDLEKHFGDKAVAV